MKLTARAWEALSATEKARRPNDRPAFHYPVPGPTDIPKDRLLPQPWRAVAEATDAGGLTLHPSTIHADAMPGFILWLAQTYL